MLTDVNKTNRFDLADSYPLSSLQQGMLFHCLDAEEQGVYVSQIFCTLDEDIDTSALVRAWQRVFERHAIFRTSFRWDGNQEPIQEIHRQVEVSFEAEDWCHFTPSDQEQQSLELLAHERRRGFDLSLAPITRLKLIRCAEHQYKLLWTYHHILVDGRSTFVIMDEVFQYYQAFRDGHDLELAEPRPYRDYIDWVRTQDFTRYEFYWRKALKGFHTPTEIPLPAVVNKEPEIDQRFSVRALSLPFEITSRVAAFAKEHGLTLNTLIQGAWSLLLHHYSGDNDIVFGAIRACRYSSVKGAESMVGLFLNTLPMRVQLRRETRLMDVLQNLRRQQVELRDYEHTPLHLVQKWSDVEHAKPLFESIVAFESAAGDGPLRSKGGEWLNRRFYHMGQPHYPLTFNVCADPQLLLRIEYDRWRFADNSILRMLEHLQNLLVGMIVDPEQRVSDVSMLDAAEKQQVLNLCNATEGGYSGDACLHVLFEKQAERTPDAVAVVFEDQQLTYRDLNRRANRVAHEIRALGIGPDSLVGLCVERSLEMVVGILAVLKAGGAYVPLDPLYPKDRLAFMMTDARITVLLTQMELAEKLPAHDARVLCLDPLARAYATDTSPVSGVTTDDLAYVIYTSGSTGRPKGVMVGHQALVAHTLSATKHYEIGSNDKVLQFASLSFDVAAEEMFPALLCGASVVLLPERTPAVSEFVNYLTKDGITVANLPSAYWHQWVDELDRLANPLPAPLRLLIVGNEKVSLDRLKRWHGHVGSKVRWLNAYGPTEAIVTATLYEAPQGEDAYSDLTSVPIGRPLTNRQIYILDRSLQPVPIGVPGELHIGGVGLARGYLNRPELTKEKFIANRFSADPTSRLYKTGDLARYLPDGNIEFLGRIDDQVKIRGFRIELGEIESVLGQYGAIQQAVVLAREDHPGDKRLVAYAVASPGSNPSASELRSYLQQKLPEYMIPSAYLVLDELPLTPNGKLDRKALPAPDQTRPELNEAFTAPRTATEEVLAGIWSEVLKVDKVGIHDNFFDLGGHSLLAVRVANLIKKRIGRTVRVASIFQAPTVERMTSVLHDDEATTPCSSLVPLQTKGSKPAFFWVHGELSDAYLPRYLDAEQPLYGLNHQSTDGQRALYTTVEDIATHYLEEILTVQRRGPYRLGGNCFGGLVAFEMAKQLQERGQKVDLLMLLNPACGEPGHSSNPSSGKSFLRNNVPRCVQAFQSARHQDARYLIKAFKNLIAYEVSSVIGAGKRLIQKVVYKTYLWLGFPIPVSLRSRYILEIYARATESYTAKAFSGDLVLFFGHGYPQHVRMDWSKLSTGSVRMHNVPGDHVGVLDDINVKVWAERLTSYLESLEDGQTSLKRAVG